MDIELDVRRFRRLPVPRTFGVGAAFLLFLVHRAGEAPPGDLFEWLLVVLPAIELSGLAVLAAYVADGETQEGLWNAFVAGLRWFGFVVVANWLLAVFVARSLEAYVKLGGPPMMMVPM